MRKDPIPFGGGRPGRFTSALAALPLSDAERRVLQPVADRFPFRATESYLSLIDWTDPEDPIRRLIVPQADELLGGGRLDPSDESAVTVAPGVQHKYPSTVLMLCGEACGGHCRYCFRKRLFMEVDQPAPFDLAAAVRYVHEHPEVNNVLLTGGDPLLLSTARLAEILAAVRSIPHVHIIRIGSKLPAFNPRRILDDPELSAVLGRYSQASRRIYLMAHFDHPRELTADAVAALDACMRSGVVCMNQCPLLRKVNDDPRILAELCERLSFIGCQPYYLFQCRPAIGNMGYRVPIVRGWHILREAFRGISGLARRPRYVMSHAAGKIEILAVDDEHIYLRRQSSRDWSEGGDLMVCRRDDEACWLDELHLVDGPGPIGRTAFGEGRQSHQDRASERVDRHDPRGILLQNQASL